MTSKYIRLTEANLENHLGLHGDSKGSLLKYRLSKWGLAYYDINTLDNDWSYAILCEVSYLTSQWGLPVVADISTCDDSSLKCYDIWVWNISDGGIKESLGLDNCDIYLIKP